MFGKKTTIYPYLYILPAFLVMTALVFYPLVVGFFYSITDMNQYNMGTPYVKPSYHLVFLKNYIEAVKDPQLIRIFFQTVVWTLSCVFFHVVFGLMLAMLLNRKIKGQAIYRTLLLVPWAVPSFISAFSWNWMFNYDYGFINLMMVKVGMQPVAWLTSPGWAMAAAVVTNIWLGVPFMMVIMLGGLQSIPEDVYEAAVVDGTSRIQKFFKITLPLLKPIALPAVLLGVIWTFNMFNVIYLVTGGGPYHRTEILVTYAYKQAFENWNFGLASTYGVIIMLILMIFTFFYRRIADAEQN
ncbi:MAG: sugar ABC transporter permease [Firmicutes bacterium]|nr:sugar ABC transporter permease [Bacillota bacterium]